MIIRDYLEKNRISFETIYHCPVRCSTRRAHSVHVSGRQVAKSVLVRTGERHVLAVLPATCLVDLELLSAALEGAPVSLATEDEVDLVLDDCERGALPPFGRLYGIQTIVDPSLAEAEEVLFMGNARHEGLRLRYRDFEALESPIHARFAKKNERQARDESLHVAR